MQKILVVFLVVLIAVIYTACAIKPKVGAAAPLPIGEWKNKKVMMIAAHPDDIVAVVGGTIKLLTSQGTQVSFVIVTNGDKGCGSEMCANWTSEQVASVRYNEARAGASKVGVPASMLHLLDFEDAMVTSYPEQQIREPLVQIIRTFQPDVITTWFPYPNFAMQPQDGWDDLGYHPDHQAVGKLTLDAQFDSGVGLLYPLAGPSWPIKQFYFWEFLSPVFYVNIEGAPLQAKIDAYLQHKTQYPNAEDVIYFLTNLAEMVANATDVPGVRYAEGFLPFF